MSISFSLNTKLSTSQKLTPQMQQAIKLLQLSSLELAQEVQAKLDSNPMLERIDASEDIFDQFEQLNEQNIAAHESHEVSMQNATDSDNFAVGKQGRASLEAQKNIELWNNTQTASHTTDKMRDDPLNTDSQQNNEASLPDAFVNTAWDNTVAYEGGQHSRVSNEEYDDYQGATCASIQDHVRWQLNFKKLSDTDLLIADYLVDAMDDMGFIHLDLNELHQSLSTLASFYQWEVSIDLEEIEVVLRVIQSCDPIGVGARSLSECLQLQLTELPKDTPYLNEARKLLQASQHLVSNNIKALLEETELQKQHIEPALTLVRTLNPYPALTLLNSQTTPSLMPDSYDIPDVLVTTLESDDNNTHWQVELNPETLPKLRINKEYAALVKRGDDSPDNLYLKEHLSDARLFIRSIEERNQNLLKVATCIVYKQQAFLQAGVTAMQPMILKDVAEEVGLHESTVSRLTTSKTMLTPQGLYSLKYFFSSHVSGSEGEVSSTAISAMIAELIAQEDPKKPLSDSAIQKLLAQEGIDIARRTVAKYREAMNIGSSTQRKQKF